ncbi:CapA family protein [Tepidibacillus sp. HK-1]|uniref:CapA family protein n=1 Tax=Tepidibacillus sp. HK-1 TaxID=1883407 RepID=UPI0008588B75|nr:CapA family protein [Tepidibacillus sp. HK-1]GBF12265.1 capsule biosynthesis protein CapA [Tepidibacillus sp. HK-1]
MSTEIVVSAVGDILMWNSQIEAARIPNKGSYSFDHMFTEIAPYLKRADLTIGNLETTLSGREKKYQQKNEKTGYPMFNCPDELAPALKKAGFDVITTANNHCMDRGIKGLKRTLDVLDHFNIEHTGTFRTYKESKNLLIKTIKGIKIGILNYTYGTNYIPVPKDHPWLVNRIHLKKILTDLYLIKPKVDVTIISLHFGREFHRYPSKKQIEITNTLLKHGADIILGSHPHVIQPMIFKDITRFDGTTKKGIVINSLGNFISKRMWKNIHTESGVIVNITVEKNEKGETNIKKIDYVPTWTQQNHKLRKIRYRVLPIEKFLRQPDSHLSTEEIHTMKKIWKNTTTHIEQKI